MAVGPMRRSWTALCVTALLVAACASPMPSATAPETSTSPAPPPDARLASVVGELSAHPEWTDGVGAMEVTVMLPTLRALCVGLPLDRGDGVHVMVDVDASPWTVQAVAVLDGGVDGPRVTYESDEVAGNGDLCTAVLLGSPDPFPTDPADIDVNGPVDGPQADAIRIALQSVPGRFGIGRDGLPAINLQPAAVSPDGMECFEGIVFVGGPRAKVLVGINQGPTGWKFQSVRIVEQALHAEDPRPPGGC